MAINPENSIAKTAQSFIQRVVKLTDLSEGITHVSFSDVRTKSSYEIKRSSEETFENNYLLSIYDIDALDTDMSERKITIALYEKGETPISGHLDQVIIKGKRLMKLPQGNQTSEGIEDVIFEIDQALNSRTTS